MRESLADVDVVVWVVDAAKLVAADRDVVALVPGATPIVVAVNKIDAIADKAALLPRIAEIAALRDVRGDRAGLRGGRYAARRAEGRDREAACRRAPPLYGEDELTDRDERFLAAEFVREKIFRLVGEEIPYSTTVDDRSLRAGRAAAPDLRERARRPGEPARDPARRGRRSG